MTLITYCINHGFKIIKPNNQTQLLLFKETDQDNRVSLLDFFSGYNISFPFTENTGTTYVLEAVRISQRVLYSFELNEKYLFVFYEGGQHILHVSIPLFHPYRSTA